MTPRMTPSMPSPRFPLPAAHAALLVAVVVAKLLFGAAAAAGEGANLGLEVGLSSRYDDNILQYSPSQIDVFESGTRPDQFSIQTRDDLELAPTLALILGFDGRSGHRRTFKIRGSGRFHVENGTADFRSMSLGWQESFHRDRRFSLSYYVLPHYYLRQLYDEDFVPAYPGLSHYRRAEFQLQIGTVGWRQRLSKRLRADLSYQYERRRYNADFRERDSGLQRGQVEVGWSGLPRRGTVSVVGGAQVSHARAEDGDEVAGVPDDADLSFHGVLAGAGGRVEIGRRGRARILADLDYMIETRAFDSNRTADTYHFGRNDLLHAVEIGLGLALRPHWSFRTFYRLEDNRADLGSGAPPSSEAGSYRGNLVGLEATWSGELWHAQPSTSPEENRQEP